MNFMIVDGLKRLYKKYLRATFKRSLDCFLAVTGLFLLLPILFGIAIGVKLSSPGPVLYRQKRTGLNGKVFTIYKFRTMKVESNCQAFKQATKNDPRVTRFGSFLRKTSLDELPQLLNVLQGRMALVGPRPHAVEHNGQFVDKIESYDERHSVLPGITGWAQVNGHRGETDTLDKMEGRVALDLYYRKNWTLRFDIEILWKTVTSGFRSDKAY